MIFNCQLSLTGPSNKIVNRVGVHPRFEDRKGRKFFLQKAMDEVDGKLLTLIVSHVCDHHPAFGIEEIVVLHVRRHENVGPFP